ncbi:hypothetical protein BKA62DRAFT_726568 [Auriculariales sp. MPI-PUGE-AT-0066]|nr:hypothetical protein BKA62DRAFT_726568 [Auriculariales sp. MPI-PUGE-AT-0066]
MLSKGRAGQLVLTQLLPCCCFHMVKPIVFAHLSCLRTTNHTLYTPFSSLDSVLYTFYIDIENGVEEREWHEVASRGQNTAGSLPVIRRHKTTTGRLLEENLSSLMRFISGNE